MKHEQKPDGWNGRSIGGGAERRADQRHITVYRVAMVRRADDAGLWRVKNMSDRGMLFECGAAVAPNEILEISLSETVKLTGWVAWSGDGKCGIAFNKPIRAAELLRELVAERETDRYRHLRLSVCFPAKLLVHAQEQNITVTSLSQFGVGIACNGELQQAAQVNLALADGVWRPGNVRWVRDGAAGICLASAFALSDLESVKTFGDHDRPPPSSPGGLLVH